MLPNRLQLAFAMYRWSVRPVGRRLFGLKVDGAGNIPASGPVIVAANHSSLLDAFVLVAALDIPIHYVITWDFYGPLAFRWLFWSLGTIPIGGRAGVRRAYRGVASVLSRGGIIGMFPEGRISRDGALKPFRSGVATLAHRYGATVLPVHIRGAHEAMPRQARWPKRMPIALKVGAPIPVERREKASAAEVASLTACLEETMAGLAVVGS
jgi:1-acyl-sn-glycerol-3-phosphate acyltransferase